MARSRHHASPARYPEHRSRIAVLRGGTDNHIGEGRRAQLNGRSRPILDNILVERFWRSQKQEAIYLEETAAGFRARRVIKNCKAFYASGRSFLV